MLFLRIKPRTKKGDLKSWNLQFFCLSVASIQQPMNNGFDVKVALNAYTDSIEIVVDSTAQSKALKSWCWKRWTQSHNNANQGSLELFEILSSAFHKRVVCLLFFLNSFCSYLLDENLNKKSSLDLVFQKLSIWFRHGGKTGTFLIAYNLNCYCFRFLFWFSFIIQCFDEDFFAIQVPEDGKPIVLATSNI